MTDFGISILAGGQSSRMGEDKGLMLLAGQAMIKHVIKEASKLTTNIQIISNNPSYEKFGFEVKKDIIHNKGPLGGICTALTHSNFDNNLMLSCDVPFAKSELFTFVMEHLEGYDICIPKDNIRIHPLLGAYKKSCLAHLSNRLKKEQLKISNAIEGLDVNIIDSVHFNPNYFKNINSKADM